MLIFITESMEITYKKGKAKPRDFKGFFVVGTIKRLRKGCMLHRNTNVIELCMIGYEEVMRK